MSQQINLILPELRPRFDWLGLPVVAATSLAGVLLVTGLALAGTWQVERLTQRDAEVKGQLQVLQQQVKALGESLGARQGDTRLPGQIEAARRAVAQRQEVLAAVATNDTSGPGFSGLLQGFAQQTVNGVWLVGFSFGRGEVEIRGRLIDAALLPVYIDKLNEEPAFAGRRFAALDMKAVDPAAPGEGARPGVRAAGPYTEFVLRTERPPTEAPR